jgi:hypothetical protein
MTNLRFSKRQAKRFLERPLGSRKDAPIPKKKRKVRGDEPVFRVDNLPVIDWKISIIILIVLWIAFLLSYILLHGKKLSNLEMVILDTSRIAPAYTLPFMLAFIPDWILRLLFNKGDVYIDAHAWNKRYRIIWGISIFFSTLLLPGLIFELDYLPYGLFTGSFGIVLFLVIFTLSLNMAWRKGAVRDMDNTLTNAEDKPAD